MNHRTNQTQIQVAQLMGVGQDHVSKIENKGDCMLSTFKKYLDACGKEMIVIDKRK